MSIFSLDVQAQFHKSATSAITKDHNITMPHWSPTPSSPSQEYQLLHHVYSKKEKKKQKQIKQQVQEEEQPVSEEVLSQMASLCSV